MPNSIFKRKRNDEVSPSHPNHIRFVSLIFLNIQILKAFLPMLQHREQLLTGYYFISVDFFTCLTGNGNGQYGQTYSVTTKSGSELLETPKEIKQCMHTINYKMVRRWFGEGKSIDEKHPSYPDLFSMKKVIYIFRMDIVIFSY